MEEKYKILVFKNYGYWDYEITTVSGEPVYLSEVGFSDEVIAREDAERHIEVLTGVHEG